MMSSKVKLLFLSMGRVIQRLYLVGGDVWPMCSFVLV